MLYAPLHTVRQQTPFYDFLHTGQLSLSKSSFSKTEVHTLPHVWRHLLGKNHTISRVALYTQISNQNDTTIGIYNVHLENVIWHTGRRKQIEYLLGLIEKKDDEVVIIWGDFNTFLGSQESCIKLLEDAGFERLIDRWRWTPTLDHLFVRWSHQSQGSKISWNGSDHTPIYGSILLENI